MSDTYIKPIRDIAARMIEDEMVIMSVRTSQVFILNPTASVIWNAADGQASLRDIVAQKIVPEFDVAPEDAYQDALTLVKGLAQDGILLISDQPMTMESV